MVSEILVAGADTTQPTTDNNTDTNTTPPTENGENTGDLPKTGSMVDDNILYLFSIVLITSGIALVAIDRRNKKKVRV
jgi:LPXTG-motif cell wall-anchored protein